MNSELLYPLVQSPNGLGYIGAGLRKYFVLAEIVAAVSAAAAFDPLGAVDPVDRVPLAIGGENRKIRVDRLANGSLRISPEKSPVTGLGVQPLRYWVITNWTPDGKIDWKRLSDVPNLVDGSLTITNLVTTPAFYQFELSAMGNSRNAFLRIPRNEDEHKVVMIMLHGNTGTAIGGKLTEDASAPYLDPLNIPVCFPTAPGQWGAADDAFLKNVVVAGFSQGGEQVKRLADIWSIAYPGLIERLVIFASLDNTASETIARNLIGGNPIRHPDHPIQFMIIASPNDELGTFGSSSSIARKLHERNGGAGTGTLLTNTFDFYPPDGEPDPRTSVRVYKEGVFISGQGGHFESYDGLNNNAVKVIYHDFVMEGKLPGSASSPP